MLVYAILFVSIFLLRYLWGHFLTLNFVSEDLLTRQKSSISVFQYYRRFNFLQLNTKENVSITLFDNNSNDIYCKFTVRFGIFRHFYISVEEVKGPVSLGNTILIPGNTYTLFFWRKLYIGNTSFKSKKLNFGKTNLDLY